LTLALSQAPAHAAVQWTSGESISAPGQDAFQPRVATNGQGTAVAIWARFDGTVPGAGRCCSLIQAAERNSAGVWGPTQTVSAPAQNAYEPRIAVDAAGNAVAVWTRFDGSNQRVQTASRPAGGSFGAVQTLSDAGVEAYTPDVAIDATGDAVAVWVRDFGSKGRIQAATRPPGGSFGGLVTLSYAGLAAFEPAVSAEANGNAAAVWYVTEGGVLKVQSASLLDEPGYPRPQAATKLRVALAIAYPSCASPNRTHGPALQDPSCNPALPESNFLTVGTTDANGKTPQSVGFVKYTSACNPPAPGPVPPCSDAGDQADVLEELSITDVRNKSDLTDYTGQLLLSTTVRITDKANGSTVTDPATVTDFQLPVRATCATTSVGDTGSTCSVSTYADTVAPGLVLEGKRGNWELGQIRLFDGGSDGLAFTDPNTVFARQGIFVP
jgi:hypothetical protein